MAFRYSLQSIQKIIHRRVFFDANVLIYLFWPSGSYAWETSYSKAYKQLLIQNNELFVDFLVISEIVNRTHRLEYEKHLKLNNIPKTNLNYKKYRNSPEGKSALSDIYLIIETNILNNFKIVGKSFSESEIKSFLVVDYLDFTDKGILSICQENNLVLLTNDIDYKSSDIDLLSSNPALITG